MRILFWTGTFWPSIGGVEVLAARLLPALRDRGHDCVIVAPKAHPDWPDHARFQDIPLYRFAFRPHSAGDSFAHFTDVRHRVADLKRAFAPHLVHLNAVGADNLFHLSTAAIAPAPLLVTLHGQWPLQANSIVAQALRAADWVVACSGAMLEQGRALAPEIVPRSSVLYTGLDVPREAPAPLPFAPPRVLCVGRLAHEKGFDLAITAFGMILPRFPRARLVIAGNGAIREQLERQAADHGLSHAVDFVGWVAPDRVPGLLNDATVVMIPSRSEGFGLVALEAALMARPVVATRVGGLPEVVTHDETGLLVESDDAMALARATSFLLEHRELAVQIGLAARDRARTSFGWERHVDAYDTLYRTLARQPREPA